MNDYYQLAKPGLVFGNIITIFGGFAVAAQGNINVSLLLAAIVGLSLVMGSGCAINNVIDRDIDAHMERTKNRGLVKGTVSVGGAVAFGIILGVLGFAVLAFHTNVRTTEIAALGYFFYVVAYTIWAKRNTVHGALVGSISGAVPPVVGYCAASNRLDIGALILFLIMVFWQMAHFYAISIYRADEYAAAGIPTMFRKYGFQNIRMQMLGYIFAFTLTAPLLTIFGYAGYFYLIVAVFLSLFWLSLWLKDFDDGMDEKKWARAMFLRSLIVMTVLFVAMPIDAWLR